MIYSMYVITDHTPVGTYYWSAIGWTMDLGMAFYFKTEEAAIACVNDDELAGAVIEIIELD